MHAIEVLGILVTFAAGVALALSYMIRRSFIRGRVGLASVSVTAVSLVPHKCEHCSGGVQVLNDGWGPFTPEQLSVSDASPFIESRSANTRPCIECGGKGFLWEDVPLNDSGYMPPNLGHLEHQRRFFRRPIRR